MTVLDAWKNSLQMLKPQNFKLLLLVTLNSFVQGWRVLDKAFSTIIIVPVIAGLIGSCIWLINITHGKMTVHNAGIYFEAPDLASWFAHVALLLIVFSILTACITFIWFLAIRPSIEQKTVNYFITYFKKFWYILLLLFFSSNLPLFILVFFIFFILDSDGSINSFFNSIVRCLKMSLYNLPLLLTISLLNLLFIFCLVASPFLFLPQTMLTLKMIIAYIISFFILYPFQICLFANIYTKKLHEQFNIYFKQPE